MNNSFFMSWSGGKDSALALYKAQQAGLNISHLFTMIAPNGYTMSHRIPRRILEKQSEAMGLELITGTANWEDYEHEFRRVLCQLKNIGITGGIFGDIDIPEHIEWCRNICTEFGLEAMHPLWGSTQKELVDEFIRLGFQGIIVVVNRKKLNSQWLGKTLNKKAVQEFQWLGISPAGEFGEYHTIVIDGPCFKKTFLKEKFESLKSVIISRGDYSFCDLSCYI